MKVTGGKSRCKSGLIRHRFGDTLVVAVWLRIGGFSGGACGIGRVADCHHHVCHGHRVGAGAAHLRDTCTPAAHVVCAQPFVSTRVCRGCEIITGCSSEGSPK